MIKNSRQRARKMAAQRLDVLSKEITQPLQKAIDHFQIELRQLLGFDSALRDVVFECAVPITRVRPSELSLCRQGPRQTRRSTSSPNPQGG